MTIRNQMQMVRDLANKKLNITREFDAAPADVWRAWTESELLDQWWAPKPWRAETKSMNFSEGGHWLYAMVSPEGERHWARVDYVTIDAPKSYTAMDAFCDDSGNINSAFPVIQFRNEFHATAEGTKVVIEVLFASIEDLEKLTEMGFEAGFTAALNNLDEIFSAR